MERVDTRALQELESYWRELRGARRLPVRTEVEPARIDAILPQSFILEHVAAVRPFLAECRRVLRPGGVMIVEVPDLMLYPEKIDALILHEHCNHFTPENLHHLAALEGFGLVETSHELCSRPFGFV